MDNGKKYVRQLKRPLLAFDRRTKEIEITWDDKIEVLKPGVISLVQAHRPSVLKLIIPLDQTKGKVQQQLLHLTPIIRGYFDIR